MMTLALAGVEAVDERVGVLHQAAAGEDLVGGEALAGDKLAEGGVAVVAHGSVEPERLEGELVDGAQAVEGEAGAGGDLFGGSLAAVLGDEVAAHAEGAAPGLGAGWSGGCAGPRLAAGWRGGSTA